MRQYYIRNNFETWKYKNTLGLHMISLLLKIYSWARIFPTALIIINALPCFSTSLNIIDMFVSHWFISREKNDKTVNTKFILQSNIFVVKCVGLYRTILDKPYTSFWYPWHIKASITIQKTLIIHPIENWTQDGIFFVCFPCVTV